MPITSPSPTSATPFGTSALSGPRAAAARDRGSRLIQQLTGAAAEPVPPTSPFRTGAATYSGDFAPTTYGNLSAEEVAAFNRKQEVGREAYERMVESRAAADARMTVAEWRAKNGVPSWAARPNVASAGVAEAGSGAGVGGAGGGASVAPTTAASAEATAEGTAANTGSRFASVKSLLAYQPAFGGVANAGVEGPGLGATAAGQWLGPGSLGRAGAYGLAGLAGKVVVNGITGQQDGNWDDALGGAAAGAGIGAGIGSVVPVVGTGVGAGVGALAGGLVGWLTGDDSPKTETARYVKDQTADLASLMGQYGIDGETQRSLMAQFGILGSQATSKAEAKHIYGQVVEQLPAIMAEEQTQRQRTSAIAATQGWLMPMITEQLASSDRYAAEGAAMTGAASKYLADPTLKAIYAKQAADLQVQNSRANLSYLGMMQGQAAQFAAGGYAPNANLNGNGGPTGP